MKFSHKLLRSLILFSFFLLISTLGFAQVGINTTDPKAMLDIESTDSGILIPRVALSSTIVADPVTTPELSELVYNTEIAGTVPHNVTPGFYYWNGNKWVRLDTGDTGGSSDDKWDLSGNAGTDPATNFVGTTDGKALHFKTNNFSRLIIPNANQIHANHRGTVSLPFYSFAEEESTGIYLAAPNFLGLSTDGVRRFLIGNEYIISYQNHRFANGTEGIPGIAFNNSTGLYKLSGNGIGFSTNGVGRMWLTNGGLGIGVTANPTERLQVNGNIRFDGALKPNNIAGNQGQVLLSEGDGQAPTWGADMANISEIKRYEVGPNTFNAYTDHSLTVTAPGVTLYATVIVNIRGPWMNDIYDEITIHNVEVRDGEIRIAISNYSSFPYQDMMLNLTVIQ